MNSNLPKSLGRSSPSKKWIAAGLAMVLAFYAFLQPRLNENFGWNLPGIAGLDSDSPVAFEGVDATDPGASGRADLQASRSITPQRESEPTASKDLLGASRSPAADAPSRRAPSQSKNIAAESDSDPARARGPPSTTAANDLAYGLLREVQPDRFLSPEGLLYAPGSAEGHRLEHVRRHASDQPSRPGKHGVFDGGMRGTLETIDRAYAKAKKNQQTDKEVDRDRTIYTVQMQGRVGYVGGQEGNRRGKPTARRVKLVLEGTKVITAYPF